VSRKKRKRYRGNPEASANEYIPRGGWGSDLPMTRGDWRLVRKAVNQDWDVPQPVRDRICEQLGTAIESRNARLILAAAWAALAMEGANLRELQNLLIANART
jgi:hypothetical protein